MTRKAFVVGWPIAHSRSPLIHRFWLKRHGLDGDYVREAVPPEEIAAFLAGFDEHGYVGGNVTLPHKEAAYQACGSTTDIARRLQAVNTLWRVGSRLCGDNTDAYGFAANLDEGAPEWRNGGAALVLGAGGASRAVLQALIDAKFASILILNRTAERAELLARHFGEPVSSRGLEHLPQAMRSASLIINTTSAGLHGEPGLEIPWGAASKGAIATDLVYVPLITPFLADAREHGLKIVDGLGMLLHQAVPGFERWFGVRPTVDADLRAQVIADLKG
jgi:shikimate dehydrogenase